jgi:type III restriction enzyme
MLNAMSPLATPAREQTVVDDPTLNSPFEEPQAHFRFDESSITDQVVHERCLSS